MNHCIYLLLTPVIFKFVCIKFAYLQFFYKSTFRIVFFISSWISDEGTSAVKLYASIADCMTEVIDLLSNNTVSSI